VVYLQCRDIRARHPDWHGETLNFYNLIRT
jgi:hypothetical protein